MYFPRWCSFMWLLCCAVPVAPAIADDVTLELGVGDDFIVIDDAGNERFRILTSEGVVQVARDTGLHFQSDGVCAGGTNPGAPCLTDVDCTGSGMCNVLERDSILFSKPVQLLDRDPDGDGFDNGSGDDIVGSSRLQFGHRATQDGGSWLMHDNVLCLLFNYSDCAKSSRLDPNFGAGAFQWEFLFQGNEPNTAKAIEVILEASNAAGFLDRFMMFVVDTNAPAFPENAATFSFWADGQDAGNAALEIDGTRLFVRGGYDNKAAPMTANLDQNGVATNMNLRTWDNGGSSELRTLALKHQFSPTPGEASVGKVRVLLLGTPGTTAHEQVTDHASIYIANQLGLGDAGQSNALWIAAQSSAVDDDRKGHLNLAGGDAGSGHVTFGPSGSLGHLYFDRSASGFSAELGSAFSGQLCLNKAESIPPGGRTAEICDDTAEVVLSQGGDGATSGPGVFWAESDGGRDTGSEVCRAHGLLCHGDSVYDYGDAAVGASATVIRRTCSSAIASGSDFTVFCVGD